MGTKRGFKEVLVYSKVYSVKSIKSFPARTQGVIKTQLRGQKIEEWNCTGSNKRYIASERGGGRVLVAAGTGYRKRRGREIEEIKEPLWTSNVSSGQVLKFQIPSLSLSFFPSPPSPSLSLLPPLSMSHQDALNQASSKMDMSSCLSSVPYHSS